MKNYKFIMVIISLCLFALGISFSPSLVQGEDLSEEGGPVSVEYSDDLAYGVSTIVQVKSDLIQAYSQSHLSEPVEVVSYLDVSDNTQIAMAQPEGVMDEKSESVEDILADLDILEGDLDNAINDDEVIEDMQEDTTTEVPLVAEVVDDFAWDTEADTETESVMEEGEEMEEPLVVEAIADEPQTEDYVSVSQEKSVDETGADYWGSDIREQRIEDILGNLLIDESFIEAKKIKIPEGQPRMKEEGDELASQIETPEAIIQGIINEEFADEKIDLNFDDTSLGDILMTMGEIARLNVVLDPVLKANKLDLHLKDVSIAEALLLIANSYDLGFKRVGDSLYITKRDKLRGENVASKVIKLKNINVEEAKDLIEDMVDTVNYSGEINSLIVMGQPEEIVKVEKIIKQIDIQQPQVVLEAKIVEMNKDALKDLGVDWSDSITLSYQENGRPVDFDNIESSPEGSIYKIKALSRNPIQFDTVIKMLENQNKAKILSNPRVTTLNDKEAEIFVGDRIPYTITNVTGGVATTDVRWVEPGIRLKITPSIIENDFVVLKVEPEVSFIFTYRGPNDEFPHVRTREAVAYVRVKNNQPFVLGGLLSQEDKQNLYKVPFFGDVPLIGNLFSYEKHTIVDTELVITVTPTIVHGEN